MKHTEKHLEVDVAKRRMFGVLTALMVMQGVPSLAWAELRDEVPKVKDEDFQTFITISVFLTGEKNLDLEIARNIYDHLRAEPWGREHLEQIAVKLSPLLMAESMVIPRWQLLHPTRFTETDHWFIQHILTTWYTGIYYFEDTSLFIAYQRALMNVALRDVMPTPGFSDMEFGAWSGLPVGAENE
ncbi:MAG: sugar dehydrogenase complex small subunit [Gallionella sp.]|nr:sugar dehydrogenase complex small subunit [Gallionella sp.]MDD4945726.1 sugar dehydrogenase complex small subunit [Gallionella sp.]MDD5613397.1 sugar dehydrogenase complex small subunit [Gallionella sp.]